MKVTELTKEQREELKQQLVVQRNLPNGTSWDELANADSIISDAELDTAFAGTEFVTEDFFAESRK